MSESFPLYAVVPAELVTVTWAVAGVGEVRLQVAGLFVALDSVAEFPLTVTVEPTSCKAEVASVVCCIAISVCMLVFMLTCCSTPANSTSCWVNWLVSSGESGSWFCSCVVSNCKKVSKLPASCCDALVPAAWAAEAPEEPDPLETLDDGVEPALLFWTSVERMLVVLVLGHTIAGQTLISTPLPSLARV